MHFEKRSFEPRRIGPSTSGLHQAPICAARKLQTHCFVGYPPDKDAPRNRSALPTTDTDDRLIASAAIIGLNSNPNAG
jgi:hypothetical protein